MVKVIIAVFAVACVAIVGFLLLSNNSSASAAGATAETFESSLSSVKFTIEGEVVSPGTYTLASNAMMSDLISAAGGVTDDADSCAYYSDAVLTSGMTYYIPSRYTVDDYCSVKEISKVNVNTDTATILATVNGISTSVSEKMVEYRENNGLFMTLESIQEVSGIGNATYTKVRDYIVLHA